MNPIVRVAGAHLAAASAVVGVGLWAVVSAGGAPGPGVIAVFLMLGLGVAAVPSLIFRGMTARPVASASAAIAATRADGNLERRVSVSASSSVAPIGAAYNELITSFQGIISRVVFNAHQVTLTAENLIRDARETAASSEQQNAAAEATAEAVAEMTGGLAGISRRAEEAADIARSAREHSAHGADIVQQASAEIERIARSVEQSAQVVALLGERSSEISGIVKVIHDIADQTNLLALNAAIEAARAGEQGRGFAVVADEVRKLAERTTAATGEISTVITAIQSETQSAIQAIRAGSAQAGNGAGLAREAADALRQINAGAQDTLDKVSSIAQTIAEQSRKTAAINEHVTNIIGLADRNSVNAKNTLDEATQLDYLALNLEEVGAIFTLGRAGEAAREIHQKMPGVVQETARSVACALEAAVDRRQIVLDDLFDANYVPFGAAKPPKYHTKFDSLCDSLLPPLQEPVLERYREVAYAIACDRRGYVPTHNSRFCQPLTGDEKKDMAGNRSKRIFGDVVGKRCGEHELPFLLQTYRRDTGEIMHDISAPVYVKGRHWGGVRIGYKTE